MDSGSQLLAYSCILKDYSSNLQDCGCICKDYRCDFKDYICIFKIMGVVCRSIKFSRTIILLYLWGVLSGIGTELVRHAV